MIKAEIDMPKLQRSLIGFSKSFGETSAQAVIRWSVQTCRELAFETQPWGKKGVKKAQKGAIISDIYKVTRVIDELPRNSKNKKVIGSAGELFQWIESNRGKNGRTQSLGIEEKRVTSQKVFNQVVRMKMAHAGIAKGGFIGAGQDIARAQKGQDKITIGKNYFGYAQKHSRFGSARRPMNGFKPTAKINNKAEHTSEEYVIKKAAMRKSIGFGLKKTVTWYRRALKAQDKKKS